MSGAASWDDRATYPVRSMISIELESSRDWLGKPDETAAGVGVVRRDLFAIVKRSEFNVL